MHEYVVRLAGHRRLLAAWRGIRWQFEMCLAYTHRLQEKLAFEPRQITVSSHRRLLTALASGQPALAAETMSAHIQGSLEWSLAEFPAEAGAAPCRFRSKDQKGREGRSPSFSPFSPSSRRIAPPPPCPRRTPPSSTRKCARSSARVASSAIRTTRKSRAASPSTRAAAGKKAATPGQPSCPASRTKSLLIKAIHHLDKDLAMPPKKKLGDDEIATLTEWVKMGAPDPREVVARIGGMTPGGSQNLVGLPPSASSRSGAGNTRATRRLHRRPSRQSRPHRCTPRRPAHLAPPCHFRSHRPPTHTGRNRRLPRRRCSRCLCARGRAPARLPALRRALGAALAGCRAPTPIHSTPAASAARATSPRPGAIATGSRAPSMPTFLTINSSSSRSPAICC